jgi:hypothetical protein
MRYKISYILPALVVLMMVSVVFMAFPGMLKFPSITGHEIMSTRLVIIDKIDTNCNMTFEQGWNLASFPCLDADENLTVFFGVLNNSYDSVKAYDPSDASDPWKSYSPNLPVWTVQDLSYVSRQKGYWLDSDSYTNFYINSTLALPNFIGLASGWNLIGYPTRTVRLVNDTFDGISSSIDYVYLYNASDILDKWKEWTPNSSLSSNQDLNYTVLYYGYWVYATEPATLTVP